mmetsp:Transcript_34570/g.78892  ORF Transcript_34570/g.78892 Transcript_34570/m.78892 type:complete len:275 (-) Transcript_34570:103-927(-)
MSISSSVYGVDASFPIHNSFTGNNAQISQALRTFGPERLDAYTDFIRGCESFYEPRGSANACIQSENDRLRLNLEQPVMMSNYTETGFKKIKLNDSLFYNLQNFWNHTLESKGGVEGIEEEYWPDGNTYTNHWVSPTRMHHVNHWHDQIWDAVEREMSQWIPQATSWSKSSLYGIRVYTAGSILAPHVDRDPLISSAIINVAQDVDEPWPLEVYDNFGNACNITMEPGDLVLYESHSVIHGRPFPLQGRYFANIFVHFAPVFEEDGKAIDQDEL